MNPRNELQRIVFCNQNHDEKVFKIFRSAFLLQLDWVFVTVIVFFVITYINFSLSSYFSNPQLLDLIRYILSCLTLLNCLYAFNKFLNWFYSVNIITNQRILDFNFMDLGVKEIKECLIKNIENVDSINSHNFFAFIFGISSIKVTTAGENNELVFEDIYHAVQIHDLISDLQRGIKGELE